MIGTKGGLTRPSRHRWDEYGRPEHLRRAVDGSLKRLRLERIDLYQFHAPDPKVPFAESIGDARGIAARRQDPPPRRLQRDACASSRRRAASRPSSRCRTSTTSRTANDDDVLAACEKAGIAFIPWYPLGAGRALRSAKVKRVAARLGATPAQVALAWLLARSPVMLPIPGTGSIAHLEENAAAGRLVLSAEDFSALNRA